MPLKQMILFDEAIKIVRKQARFLGAERVSVDEAANRVLAEDVKSDMDMPPFDKSAMDGFACRVADLRNELTVVETIPAGSVPKKTIGLNECARIMTGSIVPAGADCVIQVEHTGEIKEGTIRFTGDDTPSNICQKGEDIHAGDVVLNRGRVLHPQDIGLLATVGRVSPLVAIRPVVGIVATGNELVEPENTPVASQIRNSNGCLLQAQVTEAGGVSKYLGIAADTEEATDRAIRQAMSECNVVLMSGGVSVGDFDYVPGILKKNGFDLLFEKIAVQPGMPTVFGCSGKCFCFGLPGNPVSTFVIFEILVRPFLCELMGHDFTPLVIPMRLDKAIVRRKTDRDSWIPVRRCETGGVEAAAYHGSAHINSLSGAIGMTCVPRGLSTVQEGAIIDVRRI